MNNLVEGKIRDFLRADLKYDPYQSGTIVYRMRDLAHAAGYELDDRFGHAGLGAGPEARVASSITRKALGDGGWESSDYAIRRQVEDWLRTTPMKGMFA